MNPVAAVLVAGGAISLMALIFVGIAFLLINRSKRFAIVDDSVQSEDIEDIEDETDKVTDVKTRLEIVRRRKSRIPLRYGRHPFEVCIIISFLSSAISLAVFGPAPTASTQDFGSATVILLGVSISLGSVVTLIGIFMKDAILSAFFEAGGLFGVAGPVTVYILGILVNITNPASALGAASLIAIWVACLWRMVQIVRWIRWLYRHPNPAGEMGGRL
jgi:hypothetical protein